MRNPDRYIASLRRLGDRPATVLNVFFPAGSNRRVARVEFDATRGKKRIEFFSPDELVAL